METTRAPQGEVQAAIATVRALTDEPYARADAAALRHQRRHRTIVDVVAVSGTLAVVLGSVTLAQTAGTVVVRFSEAIAATAAVLAVVLGICAGSQRRWLVERHRAEQLRLIAFRALVRFAGDAGRDRDDWLRRVQSEIAALHARSLSDLAGWVADETPAEIYRVLEEGVRSERALQTIVDDYARGAIEAQHAYLLARAAANERWDARTRSILPALFFVSVTAIVPGAVLRLQGVSALATAFIAVAIIAPAIAAGLRLIRSAHEFARNSIRFRAKALVLGTLAEQLAHEHTGAGLFRVLQFAERLFEAEHREWLALMLDAEWYG